MFYCGSLCCGLLWRYVLPDLIKEKLSSKSVLESRLIWISHYWALEGMFGILACRSMNYTAEELRDKVTSQSSWIKMYTFCYLRDICANALMLRF